MIRLSPHQYGALDALLAQEPPGPMIAGHVTQTGHGALWVDRWPEGVPRSDRAISGSDRGGPAPRALIAECAGNVTLRGDPQAVETGALRELARGFVAAPPDWLPALESAFADITRWERVILELQHERGWMPAGGRPQVGPAATAPPRPDGVQQADNLLPPDGVVVRRLSADDAASVAALSPHSIWVAKTWGGPAGIAASGYAWGAFAEGRLVSVACSFFVGRSHEDLAVATEPGFERCGLSTACAGALCEDVMARGRRVSWSTSPDNLASLRVAEKLGLTLLRRDWLYVIGVAVPQP